MCLQLLALSVSTSWKMLGLLSSPSNQAWSLSRVYFARLNQMTPKTPRLQNTIWPASLASRRRPDIGQKFMQEVLVQRAARMYHPLRETRLQSLDWIPNMLLNLKSLDLNEVKLWVSIAMSSYCSSQRFLHPIRLMPWGDWIIVARMPPGYQEIELLKNSLRLKEFSTPKFITCHVVCPITNHGVHNTAFLHVWITSARVYLKSSWDLPIIGNREA